MLNVFFSEYKNASCFFSLNIKTMLKQEKITWLNAACETLE